MDELLGFLERSYEAYRLGVRRSFWDICARQRRARS